ncbi:Exopolysaccharide production protein ExoZ [Pseudomonas amygdali pv. mellea]|nr:Exopolysaccharide production protein ExoZ [Pseudomonas amygdali]KPX78223.1 Exopolysaccharide production protein ExoZ [Pseudomonas amygdali pv. mellea]
MMLISVQALRAFAAWVVVCHHFMQIFFDFKASGPVGQFFVSKGAVGVDIFFVISGLVIFLSTQNSDMPARRFILHRLIRIVPAYWLYTAAMALLLLIAAPMLPHQVIGWQNFLLSLVFIPSENPGGYGLYPTLNVGWTLNYEMFFYLLFSVVFLFQQRHRPLIIAAALFAVSEVLARTGLISRFYGNDIIYEFLLGIGIGILYRRGWIKQALWLPLAGIAVGLYAINHLTNEQRLLNWGLPSALIVLSCISLEPYFQGNRLLKVLGDCSYSVYLLHVLVLYGGLLMAQRFGLSPYMVFAFCVPIIAIGAWVSYEWIEKGLYRRMKSWLDGRRAVSRAQALT